MAITEKSSNASASKILKSLWGGLSPHLIARFYPLKKVPGGSGWEPSTGRREISQGYTIDDGFEVHAPMTDGTSEMTLNWTSPFENAGAESIATTLTAMLQSGNAASMLQTVARAMGMDASGTSVATMLEKATGRTGITKLNSTQIFGGMPPLKLSLTLHFRALNDPIAEVRDPIAQLQKWAVPQMLADGTVSAGIAGAGVNDFIETVFPSISPQVIGMRYGDRTYEPMVIESISEPITNPRSDKGVLVQQSIQIQLSTLNALDRRDIDKFYRR
jgi:hypothetical protein